MDHNSPQNTKKGPQQLPEHKKGPQQLLEHKKGPQQLLEHKNGGHMKLEIQVLDWDRQNNVAGLSRLMGYQH